MKWRISVIRCWKKVFHICLLSRLNTRGITIFPQWYRIAFSMQTEICARASDKTFGGQGGSDIELHARERCCSTCVNSKMREDGEIWESLGETRMRITALSFWYNGIPSLEERNHADVSEPQRLPRGISTLMSRSDLRVPIFEPRLLFTLSLPLHPLLSFQFFNIYIQIINYYTMQRNQKCVFKYKIIVLNKTENKNGINSNI